MEEEITITLPKTQFNTLSNLLQLIVVGGLRFHGTGNAIPSVGDLNEIWKTFVHHAVHLAISKSQTKTQAEYDRAAIESRIDELKIKIAELEEFGQHNQATVAKEELLRLESQLSRKQSPVQG